jgi:DNA-binding ferritin-like protein (Dps family)
MPNVALLNQRLDFFETKLSDLKEGQACINEKLDKVFDAISDDLKKNYVNKLEFDPYKKSVTTMEKTLLGIVGAILIAIITT